MPDSEHMSRARADRPAGGNQAATDIAGRPVLVVMAKTLLPGHVKTRLAATIGADAALAVYHRLLEATMAEAEKVAGVSPVLALASGPRAARLLPPQDTRWAQLEQRGETLGERLAAVFEDLFATGAEAVVAVNSDSPAIPTGYLRLSFERLAPGRIVLGPAADGGYYAVGIDRAPGSRTGTRCGDMLEAAPMGTSALLSWTLAAAAGAGLEAVQLPLWLDIDQAADLPVLERLTHGGGLRGEAAPRSACARSTFTSRIAAAAPACTATTGPTPGSRTSSRRPSGGGRSTTAWRWARPASSSWAATRCCATTSASCSTTSPGATVARRGCSSTAP